MTQISNVPATFPGKEPGTFLVLTDLFYGDSILFMTGKMDSLTIEKYQLIYQQDPNSKVFAPLAEAYIQIGLHKEAEQICKRGINLHPQFAGGFVSYAKVLSIQNKKNEAIDALKKATQLAPENLLAHRLIAQLYLETKQPKLALKAYKMILFFNPQNEAAKKAINKLESLTADEYDDEVFAMQPLQKSAAQIETQNDHYQEPEPKIQDSGELPPDLVRQISLADAFIVRFDIEKAIQTLMRAKQNFGAIEQIESRLKLLKEKAHAHIEIAENLKPLQSREQMLIDHKISILENLLHSVKSHRINV